MIVLWLACFLAAGGQAPASYRIAGTVVNADTNQPAANTRVTIAPASRPDQRTDSITGDDGRFVFPGLPRGKYELNGRRLGLLPVHTAIVTGPDLDTENIVLRLPPPAIISGKVLDDAGEPVAQALVELFSSRIVEGLRRFVAESSARADDTGAYCFAGLPAGRYYLAASGVPWYAKFNETLGESAPANMTRIGYGVRYYPNAAEAAAAEPLILKAGQEAAVDFRLIPVPAAPVFVHCEAQEGLTKQYTLTAPGLPGSLVNVREGRAAGNLYNLWSVPPGHYTLRAEATDGNHTWYGASELDAAASETDVEVTMLPAPSLSGTVVADGGSLPAQLTILLRDETGYSTSLAMGAEGKFSTPAIPPGRYRVSIAAPEEYYLRRADEMLDIPPGVAVRLSLPVSRGAGRVAGTVYGDGKPLPAALVVLSPANRATRTNSDGSYEIRGLPPGEYALFAVPDGTDIEYANPAAIRPHLTGARKIQVGAGPVENLRLDIGK